MVSPLDSDVRALRGNPTNDPFCRGRVVILVNFWFQPEIRVAQHGGQDIPKWRQIRKFR
jgi:hypothetical protein